MDVVNGVNNLPQSEGLWTVRYNKLSSAARKTAVRRLFTPNFE